MNRQERRLWDRGQHPYQKDLQRRSGLQRRTPMPRGTSQMARTPIAKKSKKQRSMDGERSKVLARLRRTRGGCELRTSEKCTGRMDDGHEIHTRGRGGSITDPDNILMSCRPCHDLVTVNPAESDCYGFTVQEWRATPEGMSDAAHRRDLFHQGQLPPCADWCKAGSHQPNG